MHMMTLGLNHTTAPLDVRGRLAFSLDQIQQALRAIHGRLQGNGRSAPEAALLSTCNRTELYLAAPRGAKLAQCPVMSQAGTDAEREALIHAALEWLAQHGGIAAGELRHHLYVRAHTDAARHAFRVASGLDSMVLGEPQILGQMKQAVREAEAAGTLGTTLHQLFQRSFAVAKEVRSTTDIGSHSISMAAAAVRLASQIFEDIADLNVLFIGAGEMIELVATHFAARQPRTLTIANRTQSRGEALAQRLNGRVMPLADVPANLGKHDIVVSCTASSVPIVGLGAVEQALRQRRHAPMFMVDLAVPRDIETAVAQLDDVYLYTVDDLASVVREGGEKRQAAVQQAETIIDLGVQHFADWLSQRGSVPLIRQLGDQAQAWREAEVHKAQRLLAKGRPVDEVLDQLAAALNQKWLHGPLAELGRLQGDERAEVERSVERLLLRRQRNPS
ncbi:glutamyl-tRNA reductase [Amphibiibacter pelophylacis]|uniref:Glutamyl-tRNA reductase n=1 Tax=Amphibiibacter pelophylacis TaxID=1799477 RepID=A0ACC6P2C2_9BURK